jgi:uncharacterized protein (TIGR01319 family)
MSDSLNIIVATDCGSTTTKAILIEKIGGEYRQTFRGEAPTTVEEPFNDVTRGVLNALAELEELSGRTMLDGEKIIIPAGFGSGVDLYISTSSAGGGLQMLVAGAVKTMTAESAQRAALGAGAIVMDVLASNDSRLPHQRIERIRGLRPDMILLSGGTDGGTVTHVVDLAESIAAANPRPRLGQSYRLPVIYAGNRDAREHVQEALGENTTLFITENLRPTLEQENLGPARRKIQDLFMEHVMAQAPGYPRLMEWASEDIMPTPAAVGRLIEQVAAKENINCLGVDIGGATTDVFSVFDGVFNRTVSANLGMSYSVSNVLAECGADRIQQWLPFEIEEDALQDRVKNKMIRPTSIPQTLAELQIEQALAREALRLAFEQHGLLATGLKGVQQERSISDVFSQESSGRSRVDLMKLDLLIGSGGVLSHAPRRSQAMLMMIDAFQPRGITRLAVDSIFMMPHLGVLAEIDADAATEVFEKDCLVHLGTCAAPAGSGKPGQVCMKYELRGSIEQQGELRFGQLLRLPLGPDERVRLEASPEKGFDLGEGPGKNISLDVEGGQAGLVLDGRGRPLSLPEQQGERFRRLGQWFKAMDIYPRAEE